MPSLFPTKHISREAAEDDRRRSRSHGNIQDDDQHLSASSMSQQAQERRDRSTASRPRLIEKTEGSKNSLRRSGGALPREKVHHIDRQNSTASTTSSASSPSTDSSLKASRRRSSNFTAITEDTEDEDKEDIDDDLERREFDENRRCKINERRIRSSESRIAVANKFGDNLSASWMRRSTEPQSHLNSSSISSGSLSTVPRGYLSETSIDEEEDYNPKTSSLAQRRIQGVQTSRLQYAAKVGADQSPQWARRSTLPCHVGEADTDVDCDLAEVEETPEENNLPSFPESTEANDTTVGIQTAYSEWAVSEPQDGIGAIDAVVIGDCLFVSPVPNDMDDVESNGSDDQFLEEGATSDEGTPPKENQLFFARTSFMVVLFVFLVSSVAAVAVVVRATNSNKDKNHNKFDPPSLSTPTDFLTVNPTASPISFEESKVDLLHTLVFRAMSGLSREAGLVTRLNLQDNTTAQARAAQWMATIDELDDDLIWVLENPSTSSPERIERVLERYAMTVLYMQRPHSLGRLESEKASDTCDWDLVPRETRKSGPCLRGIFGGNRKMSGTIPPELALIRPLENLFLDRNQFSGSLPSVFGHGLSNLRTVTLSDNKITGTVPTSWTKLSKLTNVFLSNNKLHSLNILNAIDSQDDTLTLWPEAEMINFSFNGLKGTLPENIGNVLPQDLAHFIVEGNHLRGSIPPSLSYFSDLFTLNLANNELEGRIPLSLYEGQALRELNLGNNSLTGPAFPSSVKISSKSLRKISLQRNQLSGSLPEEETISSSRWEELDLSYNNITGTIPRTFVGPTLLDLQLASNRLSGSIPESITDATTKLKRFDISNNMISGTLPTPSSSAMLVLNVSHNSLTGTLPSSLYFADDFAQGDQSDYGDAMVLDLSYNFFRGTIPFDLVGAGLKLGIVRLEGNRLTGTVPTNLLESLPSLEEFHIQNNDLTGNISFVCEHPKRPKVWADCNGTNPSVVCECCENCAPL